jgi:hypothetical protein
MPDDPTVSLGGTRQLGDLTLSRWRAKDWETFENWIRDRREAEARKSARNGPLVAAARETVIAEIRAKPLTTWDIYNHVATREGMVFALKLGLAQAHPTITDAQVEATRVRTATVARLVLWLLGLDAMAPHDEEGNPRPPAPPDGQEATS